MVKLETLRTLDLLIVNVRERISILKDAELNELDAQHLPAAPNDFAG